MRDQKALTARRTSARAPANCVERRAEVVGAEVGPERVGEDELRVRRLPEQEVRDPELARGADEKVDLGELGA